MSNPEVPYKIGLFDKALHDRSAFSCGIPAMDSWLKSSVSEQVKSNRVRVWCATDQKNQLVGFYGINAHSINPECAPNLAGKKERKPIPVVYLSAIGVATNFQGKGVGANLMGHAIGKALEISETIGAAAVVLDVLKDENFERRMAFYVSLGFVLLGGEPENRVFLSMADIKAASAAKV